MANLSPIKNLDFAETKEALKTFLKNQDRFKDFDYEGSNTNVLLDVLSYNTFYNNYYYNMMISEMFLDSASQRNSVLSHAKELNYLPTSRRSAGAKATISVIAPNLDSNYFNIPANTKFIGRCGNKTYNLLTDKAYTAVRSSSNNSLYVVENADLFEGRVIKETLTISNTTLSNDAIDTRSLKITVNNETYTYRSDIFGVSATDKVFYLQPENDGKYSLQFGQNKFGVQPTVTDIIKAEYRIASGPSANGVTSLTIGAFGGASSITVNVTTATSGGSMAEDIESIRTFAPKAFQVQERAVTKRDYETLLRSRFPNIQAISVYGGDEVIPPQFGKVIISVDVTGGEGAADYEIANFKNYLRDKTPLTIEPVFVVAKFLYVSTDISVVYDPNTTNKSPAQIRSELNDSIIAYQNTNLNDFNKTLRQSRLAAFLDTVDGSIVSSDIVSKPIIEYVPTLNLATSPSFSFESELVKPYPFDDVEGFTTFKPAISSTKFTVDGSLVSAKDDGKGNIMLVTGDTTVESVFKSSVGTVDYTTGAIKLSNLNISSFQNKAIKFTANTTNKDIRPPKDRIIVIRGEDVLITVSPLES
ncbi:baseplate J/gp47 family protein [Porticoccaceae bacterium]|nr:baseplate J/gp47 family protein [Porticoccaceae bacterium]MDB4559058.1 baseplate J/gp47 family protein [bacterium]